MIKFVCDPVEIEEEIVITDLETLKVISDPLRMQILEHVGFASDAGMLITVKQLSDSLGVPPTKLYYHVNLLEKHDLIRVVETRVVSGIIEKHYQIRARRIRAELDISKNFDKNQDEGAALTLTSIETIFDSAYKNVEQSLRHRMQESNVEDDEPVNMLSSHTMMQLTPRQSEEFISKLNELVKQFADINYPSGLPFGLTIVFNPNYHLQTKIQDFRPGTLRQIPSIDNKEPHIPPQL